MRKVVAGLFHEQSRVQQALADLRRAGFGDEELTLLASPTSAAEVVEEVRDEAKPRPDHFTDFGAVLGGQAGDAFADPEARAYEARVAEGGFVLRVAAPEERLPEVEDILRRDGAERVLPGTIRD